MVVWSLVIVLLLAVGVPPLQACVGTVGLAVDGRTQDLADDRQALVAFYNATDGPNWANNENWLSDEPLDDWHGITVSDGRVTKLDLEGNQLTGPIPTELGKLSSLTELQLYDNQLTGTIPTELGKLSSLTALDLGGNQLTGTIPSELGNLASLDWLDLFVNQLTGPIPSELGNLSNLTLLDLSGNQLTQTIPTELGQLSRLEQLILGHNQLTGAIPAALGQLTQLGGLSLHDNQLTGPIPSELGQLSELWQLRLENNQLTGEIPPQLGQLTQLHELDLRNNQLTGEIPAELGQLSQLQELNLFNLNELTGEIPPELGQLSQLQRLDLRNNQLTGEIPLELGQLSQLQRLDLRNNQLTGPIPSELGQLTQLGVLHLFNNQLTGSIPSELGQLTRLQELPLYNNHLTGKIPPQLGQLSELWQLRLENNQLTGDIPRELGQLSRLGGLYLHDNRLTGEIPAELAQLTELQYLILYNNRLTGSIPPELGQLTELQYLTLFNNQLTGAIPPELGQLSQLWSLALGRNRLTGEIPPELGRLSQLRWLSLGRNQLTGYIPPELGRLPQLRSLALDHNQLTGSIPPELGQLAQLQSLHLHNNRLTGTIPPELDQLPNLEQFTYWGNQLTGPFSSEPDAEGSLFVPVILTASGRNNSFFTSELTLTNRGSEPAILHYTYTAYRGGGSGAAIDTLSPRRQRIEPNAISYLRNLGIPVPESGSRIGTLRVGISGSSGVSLVTRTSTAVPDGRAGLSYPGIAEDEGFQEAVYLSGLRQNSQDRSNVAFQNMGAPEDGSITLRTTVFSGDAANVSSRVLKDLELGPGEFHQYNAVLDGVGHPMFGGYVKVERVEGTAPFYAYGVINDQANSDGSFVFPVTESSLVGKRGQTLPVIIETRFFTSELTVTNFSPVTKTVDFSFVADAIGTGDDTATFSLRLKAGEQSILPDIVAELRRKGVAGIGPAGRPFVGALFATVAGGDMSGIVIGARTGSPDRRGGQYSLFYNGVPYGSASIESAWIYGLQQNEENRSNLALVNTGEIDDSSSIFEITIYDGSGSNRPRTKSVTLGPRRWTQENGILGNIRQGYVQVRKVSGNNPFVTYGVINDGGTPGQRSGDGAYVPARD